MYLFRERTQEVVFWLEIAAGLVPTGDSTNPASRIETQFYLVFSVVLCDVDVDSQQLRALVKSTEPYAPIQAVFESRAPRRL